MATNEKSNLEKAREYQEPAQSPYAGATERRNQAYTNAIQNTSVQRYIDQTGGNPNAKPMPGTDKDSGKKSKSNSINNINAYLNGDTHDSQTTSDFLNEATNNANSAKNEKEKKDWLTMASALEEQLKADQKAEKKANSPLRKMAKAVTDIGNKADPTGNAGFITDPVTAANYEADQKKAEKGKVPEPGRDTSAYYGDPYKGKDTGPLLNIWNSIVDAGNNVDPNAGYITDPVAEALAKQEKPEAESEPAPAQAPASANDRRLAREEARNQADTAAVQDSQIDILLQQYNQAVTQDQEAQGYVTDPNDPEYAQIKQRREDLKNQIIEANRAAGRDLYEGLADEDRMADAVSSWAGGRTAGSVAGAGALLGGVDANVGFIDDTHRDLVLRQAQAAYSGDYALAEDLQNQVDQYEAEHAGENRTVLGDVSDMLLGNAQDLQAESDRQWQNVTEDMSEGGKFAANIAKTGADVVADMIDNAIVPGSGTIRMYMGAGGGGALEQMARENNDPDAVAIAALTRGASAWLSTKLVGGMESVYGKSILGEGIDKLIGNASPTTQTILKPLLNTEGLEEGLEDVLNYCADYILKLSPEEQMDWDEAKQDALVGYILGVITNGLSGGVNYDAKKRAALAQEAIEFVQSGMDIDEAAQAALDNTRDQVVMKPNSTGEEVRKNREEARAQADAANVQQDQETAAEAEQAEAEPETPAETETATETAPAAPPEPPSNDLATRMENGEVSEDEYMELLQNRWGRQELASALGLPKSDTKSVVDGLSLYLILQDQINSNQQGAQTETDPVSQLLGEENANAPESAETPAVDPEASGGVNTQPEQENAPEGELNNQETPAEQNPRQRVANSLYNNSKESNADQIIADLEAGGEDAETARGMIEDELGMALSEDPDTRRAQIEQFMQAMQKSDRPPDIDNLRWNSRNGDPTKVSQVYENTYTKTGEADLLERDDFKYVPIKEKQSMQRAASKIAKNPDAVLRDLYNNRTWLSEQVDAAWIIRDKLLSEASATNTEEAWAAYENFAKLVQEHGTEAGAALQAFAKQSKPGAAGMLDAAAEKIYKIRQDMEKAKKAGKTKGLVSEEVLSEAETKIRDVGRRLAALEYEIDQKVEGGMSEEDAKNSVKDQYLDIVDEVNLFRHTGLFQDTKANKKMRKEATKLNTKFRKMLGDQDMDYIQRYALCASLGMAEDARYDGKQDFLKQLNTYQKLAQLTGTGTWLRNGVGNGSFGIIDVLSADNPATLLLDLAVSKKTGVRSSGFELGALSGKARQAAHQALERSILEVAGNIDLALDTEQTKYDMATTRTFDPGADTKTAKGVMNRVLSSWEQLNGYMLQSSDAWFKGMAEGSVRDALIRANGWDANNLTAEQQAQIDETAKQVAEYRTFQNKGISAQVANGIRDSLNKYGRKVGNIFKNRGEWQPGQFGIGTALTPYTTVPANLGVKALEFSPAGMVKGLAETIAVLNNPNATMAQQNQAVTDFGRGVTGTALIAAMAMLMKQAPFFKDWDAEDDKDVKAQNKNEGKSGMQFNTSMIKRFLDGDKDSTWQNDDRTINISSMEPFNQLVTTASLIAEGIPSAQAFWESSRDSVLNMPALQTLSNIENSIRYTDTPDEGWKTAINTAASTAGSVVGGFNPAPIRHLAAVTDDKVRDTSGDTPIERSWNQILGGIPGARQTLPVKTDAFGNEISSGDVATRIANQYDAFKHSQVNQSKVSREIERLREETGVSLMPSRNGPSHEQFGKGDEKQDVKLNAEERKEWKDDYGKEYDDNFELLMASDVYNSVDDDVKTELGKNLEEYSKDLVKSEYAEDHDLPYDSKYEDIRELDNPISFISTSKAFNVAESNDTWDVVDELIGPVKKLTGEEQELMREKNPTLMNYFDFLTPNDMGHKVKDAETVRAYKTGSKASAEARNKTSPSGQDKFNALYNGYGDGTFTDRDIDAIMSKAKTKEDEETGDETITWEVTKGRAAIYLAARAGGASVKEALQLTKDADVDANGKIDEKGVKIKAQYEGTNVLKKSGISDKNSMWYQFNDIMYPWKNK